MNDFTRLYTAGSLEQGAEDWSERGYLIARNVGDDKSQPEPLKIMFPLQLTVDRHKDVKPLLRVG